MQKHSKAHPGHRTVSTYFNYLTDCVVCCADFKALWEKKQNFIGYMNSLTWPKKHNVSNRDYILTIKTLAHQADNWKSLQLAVQVNGSVCEKTNGKKKGKACWVYRCSIHDFTHLARFLSYFSPPPRRQCHLQHFWPRHRRREATQQSSSSQLVVWCQFGVSGP